MRHCIIPTGCNHKDEIISRSTPTLTLYFTQGVSLREWDQIGILSREVALYQQLQAMGYRVNFVTHGLAYDRDFVQRLPGINIYCNRKGRSPERYARWQPFLHGLPLLQSDLIKTNQMQGADLALRAARLYRKPLIARFGYMWSDFLAREGQPAAAQQARQIEEAVWQAADAILTTTPMMQQAVIERLPQAESKIHVVPNYVDTDLFAPADVPPTVDLVFVGRLHPQKNIHNLLQAVTALGLSIKIIGRGELKSALQAEFDSPNITWLDNVPHHELPSHIHQARIFMLPSHYEGHPKTLIEAMACGKPIIGGDADGIREIIRDGQNGWLTPTDAEGIRHTLQRVLAQQADWRAIGEQARRYAVENYALSEIARREDAIYQTVLGEVI